jgi:hypothetical protein
MRKNPSSQGNKESTLSSRAQQMEILTRRVLDLMRKNTKPHTKPHPFEVFEVSSIPKKNRQDHAGNDLI